jgi:hypothetical protein
MKGVVPSPVVHPNAYAAFSSGMATALLIYEAHTRLGLDLTELEAGFIVGVVSSLVLFLRKRVDA